MHVDITYQYYGSLPSCNSKNNNGGYTGGIHLKYTIMGCRTDKKAREWEIDRKEAGDRFS